MGGCKIAKFVKVFSLESFPLYSITNKRHCVKTLSSRSAACTFSWTTTKRMHLGMMWSCHEGNAHKVGNVNQREEKRTSCLLDRNEQC